MEPPRSDPPETLLQYESPLFVGYDQKVKDEEEEEEGMRNMDKMINSMFPSREWTQESGRWMQYTSKKPASRMDVISLQEELDKRLVDRQAREAGICPVREDLYSQAFDEIIRQITLDGPERGLLLLRIRDEIRMTIDAYKTLYDSSLTFGVRKQLEAEEGVEEIESSITQLEEGNRALESKVLELRNALQVIEKTENEHKAIEDKKRKEEIDFLKYQGQHLDAFLRQLGPQAAQANAASGGPQSGASTLLSAGGPK